MRIGFPAVTAWSGIVIDADKDMEGRDLTNLGHVVFAGGKMLKFPNLALKQRDVWSMVVRDAADTAYRALFVSSIVYNSTLSADASPVYVRARNVDGAVVILQARDTGVGYAEIARMTGAATAYFNLVGGRARMDGVDLRSLMLIWGLVG